MRPKRPISIWLAQGVLLLMGTAAGYSFYETYLKLSNFSVVHTIWTRFQPWFDGLTSIGSFVAFIGLCLRWRLARWLAIIVLGVNVLHGAYTFLTIKTGERLELGVIIVGLLVLVMPLAFLTMWLIFSKKVKIFIGVMEPPPPDELLPLPPPPPTFDN